MRHWMNLFESAETPTERFMAAYLEQTREAPNGDQSIRLYGDTNTVFNMIPYDDTGVAAKLIKVRTEHRGTGVGREALQWLCGLADKFGVTLYAHALPQTIMFERGLKHKELVEWYERFGFKATNAEKKSFAEDKFRGLKMIRKPR